MSQDPPTCTRRRYRDEIAAKLALASVTRRDGSRRVTSEQAVYRCGVCRRWHLGPADMVAAIEQSRSSLAAARAADT